MDDFRQKINDQVVAIGRSEIPAEERDVLRLLHTKWKNYDGKVTQKAIAEALPHIGGHPKFDSRTEETTLRKIRQVVRDLRTLRWAPILADVDGYWLPDNEREAKEYMVKLEREVRARVVASFETYKAMRESLGVSSTYLDGQEKLLDLPIAGTADSKTRAGVQYKQFRPSGGDWICDCPGFKYRKKCRHVEELKTKGKTT